MSVGYLEEKDGTPSSMRLMSMMSFVASVVFAGLAITGNGGADGVVITFGFLVGAFAPKAVQKFAETKVS